MDRVEIKHTGLTEAHVEHSGRIITWTGGSGKNDKLINLN
jgi:hypothetical protein